jgi:hypothetical protein
MKQQHSLLLLLQEPACTAEEGEPAVVAVESEKRRHGEIAVEWDRGTIASWFELLPKHGVEESKQIKAPRRVNKSNTPLTALGSPVLQTLLPLLALLLLPLPQDKFPWAARVFIFAFKFETWNYELTSYEACCAHQQLKFLCEVRTHSCRCVPCVRLAYHWVLD